VGLEVAQAHTFEVGLEVGAFGGSFELDSWIDITP